MSPKLNLFGLLYNHTDNYSKGRLHNSVLQFTEIKNSFHHKAQQRRKEIYLDKQQPQEQPQKSYKQDILHLQIDQLTFAFHGTHAMNYFVSFALFMRQGRRMQR